MAQIETITLVELSLFITSIIGALVICLRQSQSSKCDKVKICWGCIDCNRNPQFKDNNDDEIFVKISHQVKDSLYGML